MEPKIKQEIVNTLVISVTPVTPVLPATTPVVTTATTTTPIASITPTTEDDDEEDDDESNAASLSVFRDIDTFDAQTKLGPKKMKKLARKQAKKKAKNGIEPPPKKKQPVPKTTNGKPAQTMEEKMFEDNRTAKQKKKEMMKDKRDEARMKGAGMGHLMRHLGGAFSKAMEKGKEDPKAGLAEIKNSLGGMGVGMKSKDAQRMFDKLGPAAMEAAKDSLFGNGDKFQESQEAAQKAIETPDVPITLVPASVVSVASATTPTFAPPSPVAVSLPSSSSTPAPLSSIPELATASAPIPKAMHKSSPLSKLSKPEKLDE